MEQVPGNPNLQQRALLAGKAFVELDKSVIEVTGADRLSWLNDILSQKVDELTPGQSTEALWLDAQGRILRDIHLVATNDAVYLITFSQEIESFVSSFQRMVFRSEVKIELRSDLRVYASFGTGLTEAEVIWQDSWPAVSPGGWRYGKTSSEPWNYFESASQSAPVGLEPASQAALTALRVAAWRPTGPNEIDDRAIPHEFDWLSSAVHLTKGCYRGQETVAKVHNLGAPPRRLVFLHLDGSLHEIPESGAEVVAGDVVGKITSAGQHYEMGPIALALVRRNLKTNQVLVRLENGSDVSATVEEIVPADAGGVVDLGEFRTRKN